MGSIEAFKLIISELTDVTDLCMVLTRVIAHPSI
jgi:hypothetical protein